MRAERIALQALLESEGALSDLAERLVRGAIMVYPTETIYGLGGVEEVAGVRERLFDVKQRDTGNPMILLAARREHFSGLLLRVPQVADILARRFWPGPLTLVLPSPQAPEGVGIRVTDHRFIVGLGRFLPRPLYSTSANVSGQPYVNDPDLIYQALGDRVDVMVDSGVLPPSLPSTVVRIADDQTWTVLREGAISSARIGQALQS